MSIQPPSPTAILQSHQQEAIDCVGVDLNDKSRRSYQGSEELRKFISSSGVENGRGSNNTMVRLVAQEEQQQQHQEQHQEPSNQSYEMTPSNPFGTTSTALSDSNNDSLRFDISLELPILDDNMTALMWKSAQTGDLSNLQYAIQSGCTVRSSSSDDPHEEEEEEDASNNQNNDTMMDRIQLVNQRNPENECTLLYTVIVSNDSNNNKYHPNKNEYPLLPMMEFLLDHGADPTAQNVYNVQAIHAVAIHCQEPLAPIELLLKHQVDPNARDGDGWTPMHYVSRFYHSDPRDILQRLEQYGANVNAMDVTQKSPLFPLLANSDYASTLDWFIHSAKADVGIQGEFLDQSTRRTTKGTILLQAAKYARRQCLAVLTNSAVAMETFRIAMTQEELNQATLFVRQQLDKVTDLLTRKEEGYLEDGRSSSSSCASSSSSSSIGDKSTLEKAYEDLDAMATMLEDLRRVLEEDKTSTLAAEIYLERTGQQLLPRRQSLLGSFRKKARQQHQQQQQLIQQVHQSSLQKPPMAKMKNISPRLLQDFSVMSTASLGSLVSSLTLDKENYHEGLTTHPPTMERRTSLLKRVSNMLMRQQKEDPITSHQVA
ncbi:ankyrin repeat-containing domain protein [Phascolomyces articulosus]|uniref:Ankyrin repeat-containing domain protein n=1 Tax=Phascolomyces articulosus TaxID=60185 RepID=A0AAD5KQ84_9FUNG|nr:ankyrin repeat-containing domain protein [Phascolomyces articulosus]